MSFILKVIGKKKVLLGVLFLTILLFNNAAASEKIDLSEKGKGPLVVYYSRSGKTRLVAKAISEAMAADRIEIKSNKNRESGLGIFTCVLDQLLDRDDELQILFVDISKYDPIIIASPIWLHKLSSPVRTLIKSGLFQGKEVHLVLTYNGSQSDEDEKEMKDQISSCGTIIKGLYKINTKNKEVNKIKQEAVKLLTDFDERLVKR